MLQQAQASVGAGSTVKAAAEARKIQNAQRGHLPACFWQTFNTQSAPQTIQQSDGGALVLIYISCPLPQVQAVTHARNPAAWQPGSKGAILAVSGPENDVTLYDRHSWKPCGVLKGVHTEPVNALAFASDGERG